MRILVLAASSLLWLLPVAAAGSADEPELTDPAGDGAQPWANEYGDFVAAWISDETETSFLTHMALNKFTEPLANGAGYTFQFEHQGVQFGAVASYVAGWSYANAHIDLETGEVGEFTPANGSFTPGSPAIITVEFAKSFFPHNQPDNALKNLAVGSADFKLYVPYAPFILTGDYPPEPVHSTVFPALMYCDYGESEATYVFQMGGHSMHEMAAEQAAEEMATVTEVAGTTAALDADLEPEGDAPAPALALALLAAGIVLGALRRRT